MTISSEAMRVAYQGDGATSTFDFSFEINSADDIQVLIFDTDGTKTVLSSGYTLTPNTQYPSTGGTITYPSSGTDYLPEGEYIAIQRDNEIIQDTSFAYGTSLNPKKIEQALDTLTQNIQQANDLGSRALKLCIYDAIQHSDYNLSLPVLVDGCAIYWDGTDLEFKTVDISAYAALVDSIDDIYAAEDSATASAAAAATSATAAATSESNAAGSATQAGEYAAAAEADINSSVDAYVDTTEYFYPTVVAFTDGYTYRCISASGVTGEDPDTSSNWVRIDGVMDDFWESDTVNGGIMPTANPIYSPKFELDGNGDITPRAS